MTERELIDYLQEHIRYELLMLRYAHQTMKPDQPRLERNLRLEALALHARTLYHFLTNEKDRGSRNVIARDFGSGFEAKKTDATKGIFPRIDSHATHLGTRRKADAADKFNTDDVQAVMEWVEANFQAFIQSLPDTIRNTWHPDDADPAKADKTPVSLIQQTATSHVQSITVVIGEAGNGN